MKNKILKLFLCFLCVLMVFLSACDTSNSSKRSSKKSSGDSTNNATSHNSESFGEDGSYNSSQAEHNSSDGVFDDSNGQPMDSYPEYRIMEYLKNTNDKPIILYCSEDEKLTKNSIIYNIYVFKNGKCRKYYSRHSYVTERKDLILGDLAKMSDDEIIAMLDDMYMSELEEAIDIWKSSAAVEIRNDNGPPVTFKLAWELNKGTAKIYKSDYCDFESYILTDDSGNLVEKQILVLPKAGIGNDPYVLYYPEHDESPTYFMNYFSTRKDDSSWKKVRFNERYFNTGYGTKSDIQCFNDLFCISNKRLVVGGVYDSIYYGYQTLSSEWTGGGGVIFFRHPNAYVLDMKLDKMDSQYITYIDPQANDVLRVANKYNNWYKNNFVTESELFS